MLSCFFKRVSMVDHWFKILPVSMENCLTAFLWIFLQFLQLQCAQIVDEYCWLQPAHVAITCVIQVNIADFILRQTYHFHLRTHTCNDTLIQTYPLNVYMWPPRILPGTRMNKAAVAIVDLIWYCAGEACLKVVTRLLWVLRNSQGFILLPFTLHVNNWYLFWDWDLP
jgi:hypothetical protein